MEKADEADNTDTIDEAIPVKKESDEIAKEKTEEKKPGRIYRGVIACIVIVAVIILIFTLEFSNDKVVGFGITEVWQAIFVVAPHPASLVGSGMWSIIAALTSGGFIAGLGMRSVKKGILVGLISFGLLLLLQLTVGFLFDLMALNAWYILIPSIGGSVLLDVSMSIGILMAAGAVGGAITSE